MKYDFILNIMIININISYSRVKDQIVYKIYKFLIITFEKDDNITNF